MNLNEALEEVKLHATGIFDDTENLAAFMTIDFASLNNACLQYLSKKNQPLHLAGAQVIMTAVGEANPGTGLGTDIML